MNKNRALILIIVFSIFISGCGLTAYIIYGQIIKPKETWYFSVGFDKNIDKNMNTIAISDLSNISNNAYQLIRKNNDKIVSYWIDIDTFYRKENQVRIKIIDKKGRIIRYLETWLVPEIKNDKLYKDYQFSEEKNGRITILSARIKYRIFHSGDMMGLHHFNYSIPKNISQNASLQYDWDGYNFVNTWITYAAKRNDFHILYRFSYEGELIDSIYCVFKEKDFKLSDNYFINYEDYNSDNPIHIIVKGNRYVGKRICYPFGGYGEDKEVVYADPTLHSFSEDGYFNNIYKEISFAEPIKQIDWMRNPNVLRTLYNTFKSIGYSKFISKTEYTKKKYCISDDCFINYPQGYSLKDINDSLIFYYSNKTAPVYYDKFWKRRQSENTDKIAFEILKDIKNYYSEKYSEAEVKFINDTLKNLLNFDLKYRMSSENEKPTVLTDYYNYLNNIGLHQSAYNLIFLSTETDGVELDRQKIYEGLEINDKYYLINNKKYFLNNNHPKWVVNKQVDM